MNLISGYINKIDINNINDFGIKNNIYLSENELNVLYDVVKNRYKEVLYGDDSKVRDYLRDNLTDINYSKVIKLYEEARDKFGGYLL